MDRYVPKEITALAKEAASQYPALELPEGNVKLPESRRCPKKNAGLVHKGRIKIKTMGRDGVVLNHENIDLRYVGTACRSRTTYLPGVSSPLYGRTGI